MVQECEYSNRNHVVPSGCVKQSTCRVAGSFVTTNNSDVHRLTTVVNSLSVTNGTRSPDGNIPVGLKISHSNFFQNSESSGRCKLFAPLQGNTSVGAMCAQLQVGNKHRIASYRDGVAWTIVIRHQYPCFNITAFHIF